MAISTKSEDLVSLVADALKISKQRILAYALLKKGSSTDGKRSISFKLGVPVPLFVDTLNPEFWPTGVSVREFVFHDNRPKNQ